MEKYLSIKKKLMITNLKWIIIGWWEIIDIVLETIYGASKLACEKAMYYYNFKNIIDIRSLRFPGIVSNSKPGEYSLKMEESLKDTLALWEEEMEEIIKSNHIQ